MMRNICINYTVYSKCIMILVDLLEYFQTYNWSLYLQLLLKSYIIFLLNFTINYYKSLGNQKRSKIQVDYFEEKSIYLKWSCHWKYHILGANATSQVPQGSSYVGKGHKSSPENTRRCHTFQFINIILKLRECIKNSKKVGHRSTLGGACQK